MPLTVRLGVLFLVANLGAIQFCYAGDHAIDLERIATYLSQYTGDSSPKSMDAYRRNFSQYTYKGAQRVIQFLENRIGKKAVQKKLLRSPSGFFQLGPESLPANVSFYERYLGKVGVNERLKRSLIGFGSDANPARVQATVDLLLEGGENAYPGVDAAIRGFLTHDKIVDRMKEDLLGFARADPERLRSVIDMLGGTGEQNGFLTHEEIAERLGADLSAIAKADAGKLRGVAKVLQGFLTHVEIATRMKADLQGFARTNAEKLQGVIDVVGGKGEQRGFLNHDEVAERMKVDLRGFALTDAEKLQGVIHVLQGLLNHDEIAAGMKTNLRGFSETSAEKLHGVIRELRSAGVSDEQMAERLRENPLIMASATAKNVRALSLLFRKSGLNTSDSVILMAQYPDLPIEKARLAVDTLGRLKKLNLKLIYRTFLAAQRLSLSRFGDFATSIPSGASELEISRILEWHLLGSDERCLATRMIEQLKEPHHQKPHSEPVAPGP